MTWLDRLLVRLARFVLGLLQRRCSPQRGRVWWIGSQTYRPRRFYFGAAVPERWPGDTPAGIVDIAFGEPTPEGHARPPAPLLTISLTRDMLDMLVDGAIEVRNRQDIQLRNLRDTQTGEKS